MNKYQTGKIYKLIDNINGNEYYGSTIQTLQNRKSEHVKKYKQYLNKKYHYVSSFEIIKNNNYEIYLVENFPCNSKKELETREGYYIRNNKCVNKAIPCRTDKEYNIDNKEKIKDKSKQYYNDNKEKIKEYNKQYNIDNKEKIRIKKKQYRNFINSWGGDPKFNNNLLKINLNIFN